MKKNIDPQTAKLFEAARAAYIDNYSVGVIKSPIAKNVTAAEVGRFLAWRVEDNELYNRVQRIRGNEIEHGNLSPMEKSTLAECRRRRRAISNNMTKCGFQLFIQDDKKVIQLIEGYQCGIMALPRIYAELCRLVGEKPIELAAWPINEAAAPAEAAAPVDVPSESPAPVEDAPAAADPVADVETVAEVVEVDTPAEVVADATPDKKNLTPGTIIDYPEFDYKASGIIISGPIYKENIDSWQYIAIKEYGTMSTVNADNITAIYPCQDADTAAEMVEYAKQQRVACMRRVKKTWSENLINYINIIEDYEAAQNAAADAATPEPTDETPAAPTITDADVLATAARIKSLYDTMTAEAAPLPSDMSEPDTIPLYTAADVEAMIEAATADTYTADEVAAMVADAVAQERARHRRRPAPRLRPIFRRLWRVAAVVVPLVVLAMLTASTAADNGHQAPAADAVAMTPAAALPVAVDADTLQVVELPPVTVTAPRTPSGQKTGLTPSGQKTAAAVADASPTDEPTADTPAGQKTDADGLPDTLQPDSQPHGLTICEGTAWAYTMMNWA